MNAAIPTQVTSAGVVDIQSLQSMAKNSEVSEEAKLAEASRQFEGVLLKMYLKDALKPLVQGAINESGSGSGIYRHFITDILSESISQSHQLGLSNVIQSQLQQKPSVSHENSENQ